MSDLLFLLLLWFLQALCQNCILFSFRKRICICKSPWFTVLYKIMEDFTILVSIHLEAWSLLCVSILKQSKQHADLENFKKLLSKELNSLEIKYMEFTLFTHFLQNNNFNNWSILALSLAKVNEGKRWIVWYLILPSLSSCKSLYFA